MSGICGIVNPDGEPVDRAVLDRMVAFMTYRGPDARHSRIDAGVGLGHAMLRTGREPEPAQPYSLDGKVWIVADARVDARAALTTALAARGARDLARATDSELILHAYQAWGEDCVRHFIGDFAFAIWDGPRKSLFCARDHFGVKPFFYAMVGRGLVFGNTLGCVRVHPAVGADLDELAIADFLMFDVNQDPAGTAYARVRRLPPAHCLTFSAQGLRATRYWSLPQDAAVRYRDREDYVERFRELLETAIADRVRDSRIGVLMSGGLDSSAIAATACALGRARSPALEMRAYTIVYDRLFPDQERLYSGLAAARMGIPIHHRGADDYGLFERYGELASFYAEPSTDTHAAVEIDLGREAAASVRAMLTGWDGDALLSESPRHYFGALLKKGRIGRALADGIKYAVTERKLFPRSWLPGSGNPRPSASTSPPDWLNEEFANRCGLRERWMHFTARPAATHPIRPYAYRSYTFLGQCSGFFDRYDAGFTRLPLEYRHPLLDVRLIEYSLSLPPFPWCFKKEILRRCMQGLLPDAVRLRPKAPLAGYPYLEALRRDGPGWARRFVAPEGAGQYIDHTKISPLCAENDPISAWANLRPYCLGLWLRHVWQPDSTKGVAP